MGKSGKGFRIFLSKLADVISSECSASCEEEEDFFLKN